MHVFFKAISTDPTKAKDTSTVVKESVNPAKGVQLYIIWEMELGKRAQQKLQMEVTKLSDRRKHEAKTFLADMTNKYANGELTKKQMYEMKYAFVASQREEEIEETEAFVGAVTKNHTKIAKKRPADMTRLVAELDTVIDSKDGEANDIPDVSERSGVDEPDFDSDRTMLPAMTIFDLACQR